MASANQEQNTQINAGHSSAMQRQQQHQQELVKLLAQHFHHQFYQLAANNGSSQISGTTAISKTTNSNAINAQLPPLPPLSVYHQPPGAHYANEAPLLSSGGFILNGMNLVSNASNQMLHNHIFRSQITNHADQSKSSIGTTSGGNASVQESLIDFSIRNSLNAYPLNDMNLFHALGLNLTNNQLVLSLQQQQHEQKQHQQQQPPLVQATRQYDSLRSDIVESEDDEIFQSQNLKNSQNNPQSIDHDNNHADGKELLKFSINTILGRGSPNQNTGFESSKVANAISNQVTDFRRANNSFSRQDNELFQIRRHINIEDNERDERLSTADCDSNNSCSDSSLINASTTPIPQASNSILFNQTTSPSDHRSAHMSNANGPLLANNQPNSRNHLQAHHHSLPFLPGSSAFPWTVAARGKPRRGMMRRAVFSDSQRVGLEKRFQLQKYISKPDRKKLAEKLGLRDSQVKIWFQNRRMKWRNSKERELLSAGGSREQTLPTRNNPNPDLSDVGETIKRLTTNNGPTSNETTTS